MKGSVSIYVVQVATLFQPEEIEHKIKLWVIGSEHLPKTFFKFSKHFPGILGTVGRRKG